MAVAQMQTTVAEMKSGLEEWSRRGCDLMRERDPFFSLSRSCEHQYRQQEKNVESAV